jgi:hypothetical protein
MPSLRELQRDFAAAVFEDTPDVHVHLQPGQLGVERHLQIHKNNTLANLTEALAAVFPVVQRLVGEEFFAFAADHYIRRHPPRSGNLHDFGEELAGFLGSFEPARLLAYLPDVARLEWCWHRAFHAASVPPLAVDRLATVTGHDYPRLRFRLHPSARLIESEYPILRIWQVNQEGYAGEELVDLAAGGGRLLVVRPLLEVEIESIGAGDYALLSAIADHATFAEASECALAAEPDFDLPARFRHFVQRGAIADFTLRKES